MDKNTIFSEEVYKEIPIFYRYMVEENTGELHELNESNNLCYSELYRSTGYQTGLPEKPISNINYQDILNPS